MEGLFEDLAIPPYAKFAGTWWVCDVEIPA
jgi:hypothetical protein